MARAKKQPSSLLPKSTQLNPSTMTIALATAFNSSANRVLPQDQVAKRAHMDHWDAIHSFSDAIATSIATMAESLNETVEMVKRLGCEHIGEFNIAVNKTNADMLKFADDFSKVRARHQHFSGLIETQDDLILSLSIIEDYKQFQAYFDGVMHHTLITFTEFALEAQDRARAQLEKETAEAKVRETRETADLIEERIHVIEDAEIVSETTRPVDAAAH